LPSARGQGDPVSGSINAQSGAFFSGVVSGTDEDLCILATNAGYGFIAKISDLQTKNKSGKAAINVKGAKPLDPKTIKSIEDSFIVSISSEGKMLLIEAADLPVLSKGKGNKIISIDKTKHAASEDELLHLVVLPKGGSLKLNSGKQHYVIKPNDLNNFVGTRGRKGNFLPKGFRRVDSTEVIVPENN
jgi:topoisomerase-4 subunit A